MTTRAVFIKENEGIVPDFIDGSLSEVTLWSGLGTSPPPPLSSAYGSSSLQSKLPSLELSAGGNHQFTVAKEHENQNGLAKGHNTTQFTFFSGDCRSAENGAKTNYLQTFSSVQAASMDHQEQFKLGFGQPPFIARYPYAEQCHGVYSAYGNQIAGRIMLPLSLASDGGPIFVNAKQYNGIMRRRKSRAKAEMQNQATKNRKPFLHLSRHLHAVRRPRGSGGRFLNTKKPNSSSEKTSQKEVNKQENQHLQATGSQKSEVLQSDGGINRWKKTNFSRSTSPGSEVNSYLHHFQINNLDTSFQPFLDVGNTGLGIAMAAGNNYLKV